MSASDWFAWGSVPWTPVVGSPDDGGNDDNDDAVTGWQKRGVPYSPGNLALQTLDVWIPPAADATADDSPDAGFFPPGPRRWVIFLHGGAWRDPTVTSACFSAAAIKLLRRQLRLDSDIAGPSLGLGLASLNYRLSPHPNYPPAPGEGDDPSRVARHPDHIADVLTGLAFLQRLGGGGMAAPSYVLAGHSCGATLAFQAVMDPARWGLGDEARAVVKPAVVVGLNGLYDLAGFVARPPAGYEGLRAVYEEFTRGAFGDDKRVWRDVCPATADARWVSEWVGNDSENGQRRARTAVLVQSTDDTLVPRSQLESMSMCLIGSGAAVHLREMAAGGEHDDMWQDGGRMAEILWEVVVSLDPSHYLVQA